MTNLFLGMGFVTFPSSLCLWEIIKLSFLFRYGQLSEAMYICAHGWTSKQRFKEHNKTFIHFTSKKWHQWRERAKSISGHLLSCPLLVLQASWNEGFFVLTIIKFSQVTVKKIKEKQWGINHKEYVYPS